MRTNAHLHGGRNIFVGKQKSLFIFACLFAKINVLCFRIAKMVLKKPKKCVGDCNGFVCFGKALACAANKLVAICDSQVGFAEKRREEGKSI
jgi:hypothetical protein